MKRLEMPVIALRGINKGFGLPKGVHDEIQLFLAVKVSLRLDSKKL